MRLNLITALLTAVTLTIASTSYGASGSRGVINNNPGNIVKTTIPWKGKIQCADKRFECFSTPRDGVRAVVKTLITYYEKHGLDTVPEIIDRWSPPHENPTDSFIKYIIHHVGSIDGRFYEKLPLLVYNIIRFENGYDPYSYDFIEGVVHGTTRTNNLAGLDVSRRSTKAVVNEDQSRANQERRTDGRVYKDSRRAPANTREQGERIYMDKKVDRPVYRIFNLCAPEDSSTNLAGRRSNLWMDGVESGVLVFYRW